MQVSLHLHIHLRVVFLAAFISYLCCKTLFLLGTDSSCSSQRFYLTLEEKPFSKKAKQVVPGETEISLYNLFISLIY